MSKREIILRIRGLEKSFPCQRVDAPIYARILGFALGWTGALDEYETLNEGLPVLRGIDLDIYADESLAIIGKSGAGKSTLLHLMGALDKATGGTVLYRDRSLSSFKSSELDAWRNRTVGFVFQFYHLFPDLNALENVLIPAKVAHSTLQYLGERVELTARARHLLDQVGLTDRMRHRPSQLSGGEQQRVAIARALILEPELLLCDEPTGNLDQKTGEQILELLWKLKADRGQTYVVVTHDERLTERVDRVVILEDGKLKSIEEKAHEGEGEAIAAAEDSGAEASP